MNQKNSDKRIQRKRFGDTVAIRADVERQMAESDAHGDNSDQNDWNSQAVSFADSTTSYSEQVKTQTSSSVSCEIINPLLKNVHAPRRRYSREGLDFRGVRLADPLHELERANRFYREAKEYKKNCDEECRKHRIVREQRRLSRHSIMPLELPIFRTCSFQSIPQSICDTADYISNITGLDRIGIALSILGAVSIATWGRVSIFLNDDWSEPAVDMLIQIANSGTRKSSLASYLRSPFGQFCSQANDGYEHRAQSIKEKARLSKKITERRAEKKFAAAFDAIGHIGQQEEIEVLTRAIADAAEFNRNLLQKVGEVHAPIQLLVDKATSFQLASVLYEQGECQGCITAEGSMINSKLISDSKAATLFLQGHTQEPYVYENAKKRVKLEHPALPMVNLVQPVVASRFYGNEALNEIGVTARMVPYFHSNSAPDFLYTSNGEPFAAYNKKILQLLEIFYTQDRNAPHYQVRVTSEALKLIYNFAEEICDGVIPDMPNVAKPCLFKAHGQAIRFAWDIHAWNHELPHTVPVTGQEMEQAIELVSATIEHIRYAYDPCGLQAYLHAQKILESLYRITNRWEQDKLLNEGIDSSTIQRRTKINAENTNNALHLLDRHKYLAVYDDATANLKVVLHPDFFEVNRYRQRT
ncbi:DUF3987 domain-containing protein [Desulfovibrio fairfieldensis]|nr:DUF3987 domain-containing protein [Desulfovibrio fairfieldensis]